MNIEAYNLDSLRKLVRSLQDENRKLKAELEKAKVACESEDVFEKKIENREKYDPDQGERAVIDDELVWHGGMNLLGKEDAWDNLMRIKSAAVASELLELALGKN